MRVFSRITSLSKQIDVTEFRVHFNHQIKNKHGEHEEEERIKQKEKNCS